VDTEQTKLLGNTISVTAHAGRNDKAGLVAFSLLSLLLGPVFIILPSVLFGDDSYEPTDYQNYQAPVEPTPIEAMISMLILFLVIATVLIIAVLLARLVLSRFGRMKTAEVTLEGDHLLARKRKFEYSKIRGVKVQPLNRFGGVFFGLVSLVVLAADKVAMRLLGPVLPAGMKKAYNGECFNLVLEYGKMGLPQALPLGVFYSADTAVNAAQILQDAIRKRQGIAQ